MNEIARVRSNQQAYFAKENPEWAAIHEYLPIFAAFFCLFVLLIILTVRYPLSFPVAARAGVSDAADAAGALEWSHGIPDCGY